MLTKLVYAFSKENAPEAKVRPGDTVTFCTEDCFSGKIRSEKDLTKQFTFDDANPATGPVFVEGAEPGDILVVDIQKICVGEQGVVTTLPGVGPLHSEVETRTKVLKIENGYTIFNGLPIKIKPMVGVIGVAPEGEAIPCGFPGKHGGNLDCKFMCENSRLYIPVQVKGALFQLGDLHAVMGDGELCGTGLEISGKVTVRLGLIKQQPLEWPVLDANGSWHAFASDLDYTTALIAACKQMGALISKSYGWDMTDTFFYLSLEGDLGVNQGCQPCEVPMILRVSVPKLYGKELLSCCTE